MPQRVLASFSPQPGERTIRDIALDHNISWSEARRIKESLDLFEAKKRELARKRGA